MDLAAVNSEPVDVLHLSLEELTTLNMRRLKDYRVLERAGNSVLYRDKWRAEGIRSEKIETYEDLTRIPFITSRELRKAIDEEPIDKVLCTDSVVHWFCTNGTTGMPKWMPYGQRDVDLFLDIRDRAYSVLPSSAGVRSLTITAPAPFVEDAMSGFLMVRGMLTNTQGGGLQVCLTEKARDEAVEFALGLKPNVLCSFPSFAVRFAETVEEKAPEVARRRFSKDHSLRNLTKYLVTRVKKIRPKDLSRFRWGLFGGEPLDPYREVLRRAFDLEPYEIYLFTEFMCPAVECSMHDGMHLWMDICIPEIIPESELERERRNDTYVPKAVPLWKAKDGQKGEYVLTTFGDALPLVRYRFGDLMEVISTERCRCGITHPRIKVPRRCDSTICLGITRFPASQLDEKLLAVTPYGKARRWQLEVTRERYHPKPIIRVEPSGKIEDTVSFLKEVSNRLRELEILRAGIENKVLAEPVVILEEKISDEGRLVTEKGRIIYEGDSR